MAQSVSLDVSWGRVIIPERCLASRRWSHFPTVDSTWLHRPEAGESCRVQGGVRTLQAVERPVGIFCLCARRQIEPTDPILRHMPGRSLPVTSDEDLCVMASPNVQKTYTFTAAHYSSKFANIAALIGCWSATDTTLLAKFIFRGAGGSRVFFS